MIIFRNKTVLKVVLTIFLSLFVLINIFAIEEKDYKDMTDRDRILLAVSYFEVSMKYENLKNKALADSYRKEAIKIEKDVEKYYKGELEVPKKTIEIDWNSIFAPDNVADKENVAQDEEEDDEDEYLDEEEVGDEALFGDLEDELSSDQSSDQSAESDDDIFGDNSTENVPADSKSETTDEQNVAKDQTDDTLSTDKKDGETQDKPATDSTNTDAVADDKTQSEENVPAQEIVDLPAEKLEDENVALEDESGDAGWTVSENVDIDPSITISQIVRKFFISINAKDSESAVVDFADVITLQSQSFNMKRDELRQTIESWSSEHDDIIPEYSDMLIDKLENENYKVTVLFEQDFNFFIPMQNKKLILGVEKVNDKYQISSFKIEQKVTNQSSNRNDFLYNFVNAVLSNDFEFVSSFIYQDVWINEYQMLFPASELLDHLQNWVLDNAQITSPNEVVDFDSAEINDDVALQMIEVLGSNVDDYEIINFKLINKTFLPGNPDKDTFSIIVGKDGVAKGKMLGIAQ